MIKELIKKKTPYLLVKHRLSLFDLVADMYDIVIANKNQEFKFYPIDKEVFYNAIKTYEIPLLLEMDRYNKIYGDTRFKEKYDEYNRKKLEAKSARYQSQKLYHQRRVAKKNRY